jgi:hypothetical protein
MTLKQRERAFMVGTPLAVLPALLFLPAVTFLIIFPRVPHGRIMGLIIVPLSVLVGLYGLWKLALGSVQKPWGLFNALSFGVLLILLIIAAYTGLFLALLTLRL